MSYPLPLTRTEAYLAYKAGVIQQSELKPSLAVPRIGIDAWLAYWTELTNDYPKNPDGTPMILQEEEAYIAYLCGVLDTYPEKCLRRVGAYLRYIISARWGRPDHPLNREELYLSLIKTQFIPSGDPSSDIVIDGTTKAEFVDVKMYGDTYQQTYSGANLLDIDATAFDQEKYGLKSTFDPTTNIITLNGTCTNDNTTFGFFASSDTTRRIVVNGDVTVQLFYVSGSITNATENTNIQIQNNSYGNAIKLVIGNASASITANKNDTYNRCNIRVDSGVVLNNYKIRVMVEASATPSADYQPYTGGIASPNPTYPQPIQAVTGLQMVEVAGKNLLNVNGIVLGGGYEGLTVQLVNKDESTGTIGIRLTGNVAPDLWSIYVRTNGIRLDPNTTYTLSRSFSESGGLRNAGGIRIKIGSSYTGIATDASTTFTTDSTGIVQVLLYAAYNQQGPTSDIDSTVIFNNLLLEEGSTVTAFAPYSRHTHEINLGKNLFDKSKQVSGWLNDTGGISQPTSTTDKTSDYMPCSSNASYVLSSPGFYLKIAQYDANKAFIKLDQSGNNIPSLTVNTAENAVYIRISYGNAQKEPNVQFEAGSVASAYAPYFEPIELCKLGSYQDYIWKDGEDWKVHKANGYYELTDSVSITPGIDTNQPNTTRFQFTNILAEPSSTSGRPSLKCSHFKYASMWNTDVVGIQLADYAQESSNTRFWFRIPKTIATTFNQLKSWLTNNPVKLYYPLATATDTIITNQALIDQLEALVNGGSEEGTTYIKVSATDPNLPGLLYVEAAKYVE